MKRLRALFRPTLSLDRPMQLWHQARAWSGLLYWLRADDAGGRAVVRSLCLPVGETPWEARV